MKVADLFAWLQIKLDKAAMGKTRDQMGKFVKQEKTVFNSLTKMMGSKLAQLAGGAALVMGTKDAIDFNESLGRLGITAKGAMGSLGQMQDKILAVSTSTGIAKEDVLEGTAKFIELTGDVKNAEGGMALFAEVSQAAGASMTDVAGSAAAVSQQLGIQSDEFRVMFDILAEGGKQGAVELSDMAGQMAKLAASTTGFANSKGLDALGTLGAAFQLTTAGKGGKSAEGATALRALLKSLPKADKELKKLGHTGLVFDKEGNFKEYKDIIQGIAKLGLSDEDAAKIFRNAEAQSGFKSLTQLNGEWDTLIETTQNSNTIAKDYAEINKNSAVKIKKAWNSIKNSATKAFTVIAHLLAWGTENSLAFALALGTIVIALTGMKLAFLKAGEAGFMAGVKAMAPWAIFMIAALAIILVLNDIWKAFSGGESVIGSIHSALVNGMVSALDWVVSKWMWFEGKVLASVDFMVAKFNWVKDLFGTVFGGIDIDAMRAELIRQNPSLSNNSKNAVDGSKGSLASTLHVNVMPGGVVDEGSIKEIQGNNDRALQMAAREMAGA